MASVSNLRLLALGLIPGVAEAEERNAIRVGNSAWDGIAKTIKGSRNILYIGVALTIIGSVAEACRGDLGVHSVINASIIALGGLVILEGGILLKKNLSQVHPWGKAEI
jgi:hypothetical protein